MKRRTKIAWPEALTWKQIDDNDWRGSEPGTRIKRLTNRWREVDHDDFTVYRQHRYLATRRSLKAAKALAERNPRGDDDGTNRTRHSR